MDDLKNNPPLDMIKDGKLKLPWWPHCKCFLQVTNILLNCNSLLAICYVDLGDTTMQPMEEGSATVCGRL